MISRVPAAVVATIGVVAFAAALASTAARADIEPQPTPAPDATPPQQAPPQLTKPPALTTRVDPIYPEAAQREGRGGDVVLVISIDASGAVTDARVETSSGSADLDAAALEAAKQLVFSPAEWDGVPGPVAIEYKMTFAPNATAPPPTPTAPPPPTEVPETTATASDATAAANVVGLVRAAVTKDPLADVEIALEDGSESPPTTSTGSDGKFALAVPVGKARLSFTKTGYEPSFVDVVVETGVRSTLVVTLDPKEGNAFETVVTRKRAQTEVSKVVLTRDEVAHVPGTFGDPLRVIENLPGLARAPFAGGALIVRGANPEDSGVYYDGVEIPVLYHFQGLKSVINAEFLDDISFYPGGFGAYYGRATAGIVDISSRTLDAKQPRGSVDVNLLDAGFFAAAPVSIGGLPTFTVAAAARRSYIDAFLPFVLDAVTPPGGQSIAVSPVYWDYQVKIESKPIPGQTFSLFAFGSDDAISLSANGLGNNLSLALGTDTQFHRLVGRWTSQVNDAVKNVMQPFVGTTSTSISVGTGTSAFGGDNGVTSFGLRDDLTFKAADAFVLRVGFDGFGESTQTALAAPLVSIDVNAFPGVNGGGFGAAQSVLTSSSSESVNQNELRLAPALYLEGQIEPFHGFKIIPGIRGELTHVELDPVVKADGTSEQGATINEWTLDPRFTVRWELLPWTTVKAAFGVYHESPTNAQLSPTSGNPALDQPRALQVIGGVEQRLTDLISIDLQVYDTERDQLVRTLSSTGFGFGGGGGGGGGAGAGLAARAPGGAAGALASGTSNAADRSDNGGTGRTIGLDLLVRHDISKYFYGWIAYTLSQTVVDTDAKKNRLVLSQNDQTHILTVVAQTNLPWELSLGARFRLVSGDPTSVPAGSLHDLDSGSYQTQQSDDTETRLPTFQELDVRLDRKWIFDAFAVTTYLDVLNVYNAQNAEGVLTDYRARQQQAIPSLPILPVIGVQGEF